MKFIELSCDLFSASSKIGIYFDILRVNAPNFTKIPLTVVLNYVGPGRLHILSNQNSVDNVGSQTLFSITLTVNPLYFCQNNSTILSHICETVNREDRKLDCLLPKPQGRLSFSFQLFTT